MRSLQAIGEDIERHHFVTLIKSKLPYEVMHQLNMQQDDDTVWTDENLRWLLGRFISASECATQSQPMSMSPKATGYVRSPSKSWPKTTEMLYAGSGPVSERAKKPQKFRDQCGGFRPPNRLCIYCSQTSH